MSTERDELAEILGRDDLYNDSGCCDWIVVDSAAEAILAAGYRKPRTVTTATELDALPVGSIVMFGADEDGWRQVAEKIKGERGRYLWILTGDNDPAPSTWFAGHDWPATVLHEPEQAVSEP